MVIPDALLGKDLEGNEILGGKISYAQMANYQNVVCSTTIAKVKRLVEEITPLLKDKK